MTKSNLRYSQQNTIEFTTELRKNVQEYFNQNKISKYANTNMVIKSVFMFLLYTVPYCLMLTGLVSSTFWVLICWLLMGFGMAGIGMAIMHDANHFAYSKNPRMNKFLSRSMFLLGGFPGIWQYQHNTLHHGFTNIEGYDEDINPIGLLRFSPHKQLKKIHKYQYIYAWFFYGLMTIAFITSNDFTLLKIQKKDGVKLSGNLTYKKLFFQILLSKVLYYSVFLIVPILVLPVSWYLVVIFFLSMHFISGLILSTIFQTAHVMPDSEYPLPDENSMIDHNWAVHQLLTTSDYSPRSKIFSWFIGGLNHQVIHHLFPNICHVHYTKIAPILAETAQKYKLPYHVNDNFLLAVRRHVKMLKILGRK